MKQKTFALLAAGILVAALFISYRWLGTDDEVSITDQARGYAVEWQNMGMYLPEKEQCQFFRENFSDTKMILAASLSHQSHEVRLRGAYVIEKTGTAAGSLSPAVINALAAEKHELVRIYLINAARSVGNERVAVLDSLRKLFRVPTNETERLYVAAALFVLSDDLDDKVTAEEYICDYLLPYEETDRQHSPADYDELRWSAVNAVENMIGATSPIPLLDNMLSEPGAKPWVRVHVPRALEVLRAAGASGEAQAAVEGRDEGTTKP